MTSPADTVARRERLALCDLFVEVGPEAPTLSGDWTTRDLAAHLVMRERRPDGAIGILVERAGGYAEKVQASIAETDWDELVERVRSGPPIWSPTRIAAVDKLVNTVEFFVHHEDVRRAAETWESRDLDAALVAGLHRTLSRMAKPLTRSSEVGIVLEPTDEGEPIIAKSADETVQVRGRVGELVLFVYGRQDHADVELLGDEAAIDVVRNASFGI
jgi:uncharacterized protein (TIGR03085 family)